MANTTFSPGEEAQLAQTIEMFEVITESQPHDYQSLEILKEAYSKLSREKDVVKTSKRIAEAYVQMGQLSSAILEYETILQRNPEDPDVRLALKQRQYQVRAAVRDAASRKVGSSYAFLDIPDFNRRGISLSSLTLSLPAGAAVVPAVRPEWNEFAPGTWFSSVAKFSG